MNNLIYVCLYTAKYISLDIINFISRIEVFFYNILIDKLLEIPMVSDCSILAYYHMILLTLREK